jgi:hypothetical protein
MAKNNSKSHSDWGRGGDEPQEVLGEELLFRRNPYKGARKLGAGARLTGGSDEDFWMALVQTSYHPATPPVPWEHGGTNHTIRKAARIPYLVKDDEGQLALDHLLVGYIEPDTTTTVTPAGRNWGGNDPESDVGRLGRLIMVDLYPGKRFDTPGHSFGNSLPLSSWPNNFNEDPVVYVPSATPAFWPFRGVPCRVEKSILVDYAAKMASGVHNPGKLLVGYEGSGGW